MDTSLLIACLVASTVGSLHCAGMCGPLVAFVVAGSGAERSEGTAEWRLLGAYHLSRGAGYMVLGAVAGLAGHLIELAGVLAGLSRLAAVLAGATLILTGLIACLRHFGLRWMHVHPPAWLTTRLRVLQQRALKLPATSRALAIGATTTLLPCGWLYAFAAAAAGTGHPLSGAALMFAFWLGTVPILSAVGFGTACVTSRLGGALRLAASIALVVLGVWTLSGRSALAADVLVQRAEQSSNFLETGGPVAQPACCEVEGSAEAR